MKNTALAARVMAHVEHLAADPTGPDRWSQNVWGVETDCGTLACFAGWTVMLADGPEGFDEAARTGTIPPRACELLGVEYNGAEEALLFFDTAVDPDRLRETVESVFGKLPAVETATI